ncbi:MAG: hypothetical protein QW478_03455 [Candidatus Micrarchaeaceae archaeon]
MEEGVPKKIDIEEYTQGGLISALYEGGANIRFFLLIRKIKGTSQVIIITNTLLTPSPIRKYLWLSH